MKKVFFLFLILSMLTVGFVNGYVHSINTIDETGEITKEFDTSESIYINSEFIYYPDDCSAIGEVCKGDVNIYTVQSNLWTENVGEKLFERGGGIENVKIEGECKDTRFGLQCFTEIQKELVWDAPTKQGEYQVIVDVNKDGVLGQADPITSNYPQGIIIESNAINYFTTLRGTEGEGITILDEQIQPDKFSMSNWIRSDRYSGDMRYSQGYINIQQGRVRYYLNTGRIRNSLENEGVYYYIYPNAKLRKLDYVNSIYETVYTEMTLIFDSNKKTLSVQGDDISIEYIIGTASERYYDGASYWTDVYNLNGELPPEIPW